MVGSIVFQTAESVQYFPLTLGRLAQQLAVSGEAGALVVDYGQFSPALPRRLHIGAPLPAQLLKKHVHQKAGGDVWALSHQLGAQRGFCRVVAPDEVAGGPVVVKALPGVLV